MMSKISKKSKAVFKILYKKSFLMQVNMNKVNSA